MRNAELSQQLTGLQQTIQDERRAFEQEKQTLEADIVAKTDSEETLKQQCQQYESKV